MVKELDLDLFAGKKAGDYVIFQVGSFRKGFRSHLRKIEKITAKLVFVQKERFRRSTGNAVSRHAHLRIKPGSKAEIDKMLADQAADEAARAAHEQTKADLRKTPEYQIWSALSFDQERALEILRKLSAKAITELLGLCATADREQDDEE